MPIMSADDFEAFYRFDDLDEAFAAARGAVLLGLSFQLEDRWTVDELLDPHTEQMLQSLRYHLHVTNEQTYEASEDDE